MIVIEGEPIGKGRPRVSSRSGTIYTPRKTHAYEDALRFAGKLAKERCGDSPVIAVVTAFSEVPSSWSKKKKALALTGLVQKETKPDIDNVIKSALDGLQPVCFTDDKQIVAVVGLKAYAEKPRLEVELYVISEEDENLKAQSGEVVYRAKDLRGLIGRVIGGVGDGFDREGLADSKAP